MDELRVILFFDESEDFWFAKCVDRGLLAKGTTPTQALEFLDEVVKLDYDWYRDHPETVQRRPLDIEQFEEGKPSEIEFVTTDPRFKFVIREEMKSHNNMNFSEFLAIIEDVASKSAHCSRLRMEDFPQLGECIAFVCLVLDRHVHLSLMLLHLMVPTDKWPPIPCYYMGRIPVILLAILGLKRRLC